jgi:putative transposase
MKQRFSEEQFVQILREAEGAPSKTEVCRKHGISEWTHSRWRRRYDGTAEAGVSRRRLLEQENARLKRLLAARVLVERWRREYNKARPHSALGYRPPAELAASAQVEAGC